MPQISLPCMSLNEVGNLFEGKISGFVYWSFFVPVWCGLMDLFVVVMKQSLYFTENGSHLLSCQASKWGEVRMLCPFLAEATRYSVSVTVLVCPLMSRL